MKRKYNTAAQMNALFEDEAEQKARIERIANEIAEERKEKARERRNKTYKNIAVTAIIIASLIAAEKLGEYTKEESLRAKNLLPPHDGDDDPIRDNTPEEVKSTIAMLSGDSIL